MTDPFGTAALRESVLASWLSSPTRFREDANAEEDLYLGGYRDRLLVELAQNAADAAGSHGTLKVSIVDNELRVANTGTPLDAAGVSSLASLRASTKGHGVGRFGVGFAAVLTVTDEPRVVSATGGVAFSAAHTRAAIAAEPALAERVAERDGRVPVLRLAWPTDGEDPLPDGFDTEVRLPIRAGIDPNVLLVSFAAQAIDLLLSLESLTRIEIGAHAWHREGADAWQNIHSSTGTSRWVIVRDSGELPAGVAGTLGVEDRPQWTVCWALKVDEGRNPDPQTDDVLHAPTRTDERLSLPARLIATLPIEPSRRRVLPGPAADVVLAAAARKYPELTGFFGDIERPALVPLPGFPLSEVDDRLRQLVLGELRTTRWLAPAMEHSRKLAPAEARLLPVPNHDLADALADVVSGLADAELAAPEHAAVLAALDIPRLTLSDVVDSVTGIDRAPTWWRSLYRALAQIVDNDPSVRDELGALPVPLIDGRTLPGPRGALLIDGLTELSSVDAINVVHPEATHPLLERLGARRGGAGDLLESASLMAAVEQSLDDAESGMDTEPLTDAVLRLVGTAGVRPGEKAWLGALALPDTNGDWRRADELALPGSPFLELLAADSPLGVLAAGTAAGWPAETLAAVGVLDSFALVVDESPAGPDHDLADEHDWWDSHQEPPSRLIAVRDLDLVADHAWPAALRLLAGQPETWQALHEPGGYTAWWIANHALLAGAPPRDWRLADARELAGLYDPVPPVDVDPKVLAAVGVRAGLVVESTRDAEELLARLGDPGRTVRSGVARRTYAALAAAVRDGVVDPADLEPPQRVRAANGEVVDDGVVLDAPWFLPLAGAHVVGAEPDTAEALAELLDLPLATEELDGAVESTGEAVRWADLGAVVDACDLAGIDVPPGGPLVHERLTVSGRQVPWWIDEANTLHCADSTEGLARALAWVADRWSDRHTLAALLDDPDNHLA